jgi:hypothetical protein
MGDKGKGESVIRNLVGAISLGCACLLGFTNDRSVAKDDGKLGSMRFEWRMEGPAEDCGQSCRRWISATGVVTEGTARDFETFAKDNEVRGATLVLDSEGGSVLAALALGRAIRRFDMTTTVGKTAVLPSPDGSAPRAMLSPKAQCESMCAFILLGGARRYVPPEARVLVHQIWLGSKSKRALESSYSAEELRLVERDIGSLARYTVEMGGGIELLETALRIPPWEAMYSLSRDELRRMQVVTIDRLFEEGAPIASAPARRGDSMTTTAQAQ